MRYEELPPSLRRQVDAKLGAPPKRARTEARGSTSGACVCGERFTSYPKWERHSDAEGAGHRRWCLEVA